MSVKVANIYVFYSLRYLQTYIIARTLNSPKRHPYLTLTGQVWFSYPMMTSSNGDIFRVTGPLCGEFEFPAQRPVTRSFDVFFDLRLIKRLSKHSRGWWFKTLWRQCNCPACRTTFIATRFRVAVICPIIPVPHCIRVFFYFVWFVFINHIFQFYYELCTYCNILDIYLS